MDSFRFKTIASKQNMLRRI